MTSSVLRIARNDFINVRRSRLLWGVVAAYALLIVLLTGAGLTTNVDSAAELLVGFVGITAAALPVVALVAGYLSIAGEREAGTIKLRLGLPDSRLALVTGKLVSRSMTVCLGLAVAFGIALAIALISFDAVDITVYARFIALSVLFALTNVAVAVGLSAFAATRARAMTLAMGFYVCLNVLWLLGNSYIVAGARGVANALGVAVSANAASFVSVLSPIGAYLEAMELAFASGLDVGTTGVVPWLGVAMLVVWGIIVPSAGYCRFRTAELA